VSTVAFLEFWVRERPSPSTASARWSAAATRLPPGESAASIGRRSWRTGGWSRLP